MLEPSLVAIFLALVGLLRGVLATNDVDVLRKSKDAISCATSALRDCFPMSLRCVADICSECARYPAIESCCDLSKPRLQLECLIDATGADVAEVFPIMDSSLTRPMTIPSVDTIVAPPVRGGLRACLRLESFISSCEAETAGFATMPFRSQAGCLCYDSTKYRPGVFDGSFSTCVEYVSSAELTIYGILTSAYPAGVDLAPCRRDDIVGPTRTSTPTATGTETGNSTEVTSSTTSETGSPTSSPITTAAPTASESQASETSGSATGSAAAATSSGFGAALGPVSRIFRFERRS